MNQRKIFGGLNYFLVFLCFISILVVPAKAVVSVVPPEIKDVYIKENPMELGDNVYIEMKVEDAALVDQALLEYDGVNHTMLSKAAKKWYYDEWKPLTTGEHIFTIYARISKTQWISYTGIVKVVADSTAPSTIITNELPEKIEPGTSIPISIYIEDINEITQVLLEFNHVNYSMINVPNTSVWNYNLVAPEAEGFYDYLIHAQDIYNNWNHTTGSFSVSQVSTSDDENADSLEQADNPSIPHVFILISLLIVFIAILSVNAFINARRITLSRISPEGKQYIPKQKKGIQYRYIEISCPSCETSKSIYLPQTIHFDTNGMSTISVPSGLVCAHTFQFFIDKDFAIRGYQAVDFELSKELK